MKSTSVRFDPDFFVDFNKKRLSEKDNSVANAAIQASTKKSALSDRFYPVPEFINHEAVGKNESKPAILGNIEKKLIIQYTDIHFFFV